MKQKNKNGMNDDTSLNANFSNIFVVNGVKNRAFIEQFNYNSVNFTQKPLGSILGFFIVRDNTQTSENVVNFLASEVRKKYFSPIQKNAEEKFELTLHHINRALEELANIGNVNWLGKIDSAICVIDSTTIHFSVTGNAYILLLRDNSLIEISKGLASQEAIEQPLKTFVDISSGELFPNDKIIITSQELLDFIPFNELQKNAINFNQENFIQFIETVLTNECSIATTTIIDIYKKIKPKQIKSSPTKNIPSNAFSATTFKKEQQLNIKSEKTVNLKTSKDKPSEYTDPRTGHIHIQGDDQHTIKKTLFTSMQTKLLETFDDIKEFIEINWHSFSKKIFNTRNKNKSTLSSEDIDIFDDTEAFDDIPNNFNTSLPNTSTSEKVLTEQTLHTKYFKSILHKIKYIWQVIYSTLKNALRNINFYWHKIKNGSTTTKTNHQEKDKFLKNSSTNQKYSFLPNIRHVTELWHKMNIQTKLTAISILLFIIIVPLIIAKISKKNPDTLTTKNLDIKNNINIQEQTNIETRDEAETSNNHTQNTIGDPTTILAEPSINSAMLINDKLIGITKNNIILLNDTKNNKFIIPQNSGDIAFAAPMDDLDLIFILTTKDELFSFSPTTKKFIQQKNIPSFNHLKILNLGTYMTYLYILDTNMITRYARIENGFDDGKKWLKENITLSKTSTMAIDDNIYITQNGKIIKLNKGKKTSFTQDPSINKISYIYTTKNTKFIWLLDKENNTLFKVNKSTGQKVDSYIRPEFHETTSLTVSEQKNIAIISTSNNILSFKLDKLQ